MSFGFDLSTFSFGQPVYLWLLIAPAILLILWARDVLRRRSDARRYAREHVLPLRVRYASISDLTFWLCLIVAVSLCIVAVARPRSRVLVPGTAGADFVILQDGSASMYTRDIRPDRWQRSIQFVRTFTDSLNWKQDRVALALFAYFAAPQIRLTKDPNALFFFLDHLSDQSPFRLEDDPTWNTNIEEGVLWGLKLLQVNEELFGKTNNPKAFVVISDGQAWSGRVATALAAARGADVAVYVVGVGTTAGGLIPASAGPDAPLSRVHAALDRDSLRTIARGAGGQYFEIGREPDRDVAERIISGVRRRAPVKPVEESDQEIYWRFLIAAAVFVCLGTFALRQGVELWWQAASALLAVIVLVSLA